MLISIAKLMQALSLKAQYACEKKEIEIESADLNRPGLQFCGFFQYFAADRIQVIGMAEMAYLDTLPRNLREDRLERYFAYDIPCLVICRDIPCPPDIEMLSKKKQIPVFLTDAITVRFEAMAILFLARELAPRKTMHGGLIDVDGVGLLLTGESGVGKSEAALELIKRGHTLVADDVVEVTRVSDRRLTGEAPEMTRNFMEIRGIGIIDIRAMYGVVSVAQQKSIDLNIHLEHWVKERDYDRLGKDEMFTDILDVRVPYLLIPVRPGRNLAIVLEVAARNFRLRRMGYSAVEALDNRLMELRGGM